MNSIASKFSYKIFKKNLFFKKTSYITPFSTSKPFSSTNTPSNNHPYKHLFTQLDNEQKFYYDLNGLNDPRYYRLPYSIRILLESGVRNWNGKSISENDIETILNWHSTSKTSTEVPFLPARVLLQDFTGVPSCVDLAALRDAMARLGGDPSRINPLVPVDLVVDHSVQVDYSRSLNSLEKNEAMEMTRNSERFSFLKWASKSFDNLLIVPPGSGIVHQVNLEYLARCVFDTKNVLYPDSVVGTDSHTTMIDALGVVGWGVGGIEAEAVMLGQPMSMVLPEVIGFELKGELPLQSTATDLVLTITEILRKKGVVGKFVEFFGGGVRTLSLADRATIANMAPEYGATMGFFPFDEQSIVYLTKTGRNPITIDRMTRYLKKNDLFINYNNNNYNKIEFSDNLFLDLSTVLPCVAGPKRPQDKVLLSDIKHDFQKSLSQPIGFKGYNLKSTTETAKFKYKGQEFELSNGSIVIASITSCTNTSNPNVLIGAGLLAKMATERGLTVKPYIKTSLSPGSKAVTKYLESANLLPYFEKLGFYHAGYGCMTCIGNSGELDSEVTNAINSKKELIVTAVLSGNRNFEGRVHPLTRANYLASPPLVIAFALAGRINIDFDNEPVGYDQSNQPVYLNEIWPLPSVIASIDQEHIKGALFSKVYENIKNGTNSWNALPVIDSKQYPWNVESTYIHNPPFFKNITKELPIINNIDNARCLLLLGHSITTDHISPAGNIAINSPAANYLQKHGVEKKDFNTYGTRRGNDEIMVRGTFANIRLINQMCPDAGPKTYHYPSNELLYIFDAAEKYKNEKVPLIVLAGKEYGSGSSRDWAAKGPFLLGIKVIIAESFERIHRTNLVGMGILPLQFINDETSSTHNLTGKETFSINMKNGNFVPGEIIDVKINENKIIKTKCRIDTDAEVDYFKSGGILPFVFRNMI